MSANLFTARPTHTDLPVMRSLPNGRMVLDTGRVHVGALYTPPARDIGSEAERIQTALLKTRFEGDMRPDSKCRLRGLPAPIRLDSSLRGRIERLWNYIVRRFS
jgi:hypothetical protein